MPFYFRATLPCGEFPCGELANGEAEDKLAIGCPVLTASLPPHRGFAMHRTATLLTRRALLRHTAEAAAFTLGCSAFSPLLAAPASRGFKIGACDWSLGKRGDPTALDIAKQIGLDGVQIDFGTAGNDMRLRTPEHQQAYREAMQRTGLVVSSMALCEMNEVPLKSDPARRSGSTRASTSATAWVCRW